MNTALLSGIEDYVTRFFAEHPRPELTYHNLTHTREVVQATDLLARNNNLSETDHLTVVSAAWFHDTGYLIGPPEDHERNSKQVATTFLHQAGMPESITEKVIGCIRATEIPQSPENLLEKILCDADLFHLGGDNFSDKQKLLRKERELLTDAKISGREWRRQNIDFLSRHQYFTQFAQTLLAKGQSANVKQLREKQAEKENEKESKDTPIPLQTRMADLDVPAPEGVKKKNKKPERGIETMFRTTTGNHIRLSEIADSKANIMISVNSIMISVMVSVLPRRIEEWPALMGPTVVFLLVAVLTIICAVLATRPNVTQGKFTREDIQQKRGNLLFFGNFYQMSLSEYEWGINELMNDSDYLYASMTRDIYFLGKVLGRKYQLLRWSYTIFMVGLVLSVLAFVTVFLFFVRPA